MSIDKKNRSNDLPQDGMSYKGFELIDIDTTIFNYIQESIIPKLYQNGELINIPVIYGNAERWADVRKNGHVRDERGTVQAPLIVFKRGSIERSDSIPYFKDGTVMPSIALYSRKNRYERFNIHNDIKPIYEIYNIAVPTYVTITYDVIALTSFTEHMNKILEQFQYASNRYWGNKDGYRFYSKIDSLDSVQEVNDSEARIIKTEFSITVNAFIIPTEHKNKLTIDRTYSSKKIIHTVESADTGFNINKPKMVLASYVNDTTVSVNNIKNIAKDSKYRIYINNIPVPISDVQYIYNESSNELIFSLLNRSISLNDTVFVKGSFI